MSESSEEKEAGGVKKQLGEVQREDLQSKPKKGRMLVGKGGLGALYRQRRSQIEQWSMCAGGFKQEEVTVYEDWWPPGKAETQHGGQLQD